jgi:hypothetical protein
MNITHTSGACYLERRDKRHTLSSTYSSLFGRGDPHFWNFSNLRARRAHVTLRDRQGITYLCLV